MASSYSFHLLSAARMAQLARTTDSKAVREWALEEGKRHLLQATFAGKAIER